MSAALITGVVLLALAGASIGTRHLYLRMDRPGGVTCSMRVAQGELAGLGRRFQAGYAGPQMRELLWRRIAWPGRGITFPLTAIRFDRERRPLPGERWWIPPAFSVLPVELADGVVLELAMPRKGLVRIVGLVDGGAR